MALVCVCQLLPPCRVTDLKGLRGARQKLGNRPFTPRVISGWEKSLRSPPSSFSPNPPPPTAYLKEENPSLFFSQGPECTEGSACLSLLGPAPGPSPTQQALLVT